MNRKCKEDLNIFCFRRRKVKRISIWLNYATLTDCKHKERAGQDFTTIKPDFFFPFCSQTLNCCILMQLLRSRNCGLCQRTNQKTERNNEDMKISRIFPVFKRRVNHLPLFENKTQICYHTREISMLKCYF